MSLKTQRSAEHIRAYRVAGSAVSKLTAQGDYIAALASIKNFKISELQMIMLYGGFSVISHRHKTEFMLHCQREIKAACDARISGYELHVKRQREQDANRLATLQV